MQARLAAATESAEEALLYGNHNISGGSNIAAPADSEGPYEQSLDRSGLDDDDFGSGFGGSNCGFDGADGDVTASAFGRETRLSASSPGPPDAATEAPLPGAVVRPSQAPAQEGAATCDAEASAMAASFAAKAAARRSRAGKKGGRKCGQQPNSDSAEPHKLRLEDLEELGTLGTGGYSHVSRVRVKPGRALPNAAAAAGGRHVDGDGDGCFALKAMSKQHLVKRKQTVHVRAERDALRALDACPFVCGLRETFQDSSRLYFLLELCKGGELFSRLVACDILGEAAARFYGESTATVEGEN